MSLFDLNDIPVAPGHTPKRPRTPTPPQPVPDTVEVVVTDRWRFVHRSQPGVVHASSHVDKKRRALVTFCGLVGTPLSFTAGETVHGCAKCIERGAPT